MPPPLLAEEAELLLGSTSCGSSAKCCSQNEMKARPGLPRRVRSMERLGRILSYATALRMRMQENASEEEATCSAKLRMLEKVRSSYPSLVRNLSGCVTKRRDLGMTGA